MLAATIPARLILEEGFTAVRSVGAADGIDLALKHAVDSGVIAGPRMWVSLEPLSPVGGHGDPTNTLDPNLPFDPLRLAHSVVTGPVEVTAAVRDHHKRGADLIKIMPSGGVMSTGDNPHLQLMTNEEIKAAIDTAHALGMKVAAHAQGKEAIDNTLRLGVDSIEHGTYADAESFALFKQHGAYLVPTIIVAMATFDRAAAGETSADTAAKVTRSRSIQGQDGGRRIQGRSQDRLRHGRRSRPRCPGIRPAPQGRHDADGRHSCGHSLGRRSDRRRGSDRYRSRKAAMPTSSPPRAIR